MKKYTVIFVFAWFSSSLLAQDTTRVSLLFLGDIMQHDSQIADAFNPITKQYDYNPCFQFVKPYTQTVDLAIGNLELTLAGPPYKGYPQFSAPDELLFALRDMGMDVLVTANNHCVDRGKKGLERTLVMLDSLGIQHTGTFADDVDRLNEHPLIIYRNGFKLALLNYTYGTNGLPVTAPNIVNRIDTTAIRQDLQYTKSLEPDAIIVMMHWGAEYQSLPSKWQKEVAGVCFRNGAKLVIGAHPHVLQPMEWRKTSDQLVAYSLGNFVSGQRKRYTDGGAMLNVDLRKITYAADSATTTIDSAGYVLEWVYRTADNEKNYFVLPVPKFEADPAFVRDAASRDAFSIFVNDSRALFQKHNAGVGERRAVPADSISTYRVQFLTVARDSTPDDVTASAPYGVEKEVDADGNIKYFSGVFLHRQAAERYVKKLARDFGYSASVVVEYVNGVRKN